MDRCLPPGERIDPATIARIEAISGLVDERWESYEHYVHTLGLGDDVSNFAFCEAYRQHGHCDGYDELGGDGSQHRCCDRLHASGNAVAEFRRVRRHRGRQRLVRRHWCADNLAGLCGAGGRCPHPHLNVLDVRGVARFIFERSSEAAIRAAANSQRLGPRGRD